MKKKEKKNFFRIIRSAERERRRNERKNERKKLHQRIKKNSNGISYRHLNFYTQHSVSVIHEDDEKRGTYLYVL